MMHPRKILTWNSQHPKIKMRSFGWYWSWCWIFSIFSIT